MSTNNVWSGKYFTVQHERIQTKNGDNITYEYVFRVDGTRTLAQDHDGKFLINCEFRDEIKDYDWRLPGGKLEQPDENVIDAAKRELKEESGVSAEEWKYITSTSYDSMIRFKRHFLYAHNIKQDSQKLDPHEVIEPYWVSKEELYKMALTGKIREEISALFIIRFINNQFTD